MFYYFLLLYTALCVSLLLPVLFLAPVLCFFHSSSLCFFSSSPFAFHSSSVHLSFIAAVCVLSLLVVLFPCCSPCSFTPVCLLLLLSMPSHFSLFFFTSVPCTFFTVILCALTLILLVLHSCSLCCLFLFFTAAFCAVSFLAVLSFTAILCGVFQKLTGRSIHPSLRMFGQAISGGVDMDQNGYPGGPHKWACGSGCLFLILMATFITAEF